jgi:hypothetical protein
MDACKTWFKFKTRNKNAIKVKLDENWHSLLKKAAKVDYF